MNLIKDITNLQKLSVGEHSLEEVAQLAGFKVVPSSDKTAPTSVVPESNESDSCPDCGGALIHEYDRHENETWTCVGCGNTWSN